LIPTRFFMTKEQRQVLGATARREQISRSALLRDIADAWGEGDDDA
jgi:hypothetical protein